MTGEIQLAPVLGTLTATSWTPPKDMTLDQWTACGEQLVRMERAVGWWLGDWWNAGQPYGERVEQVKEKLDLKLDTVRHYAAVAKNVRIRIHTLSFAHHRLVETFKPAEQKEWLDRAEREGWAIRDMRLALYRERKQQRHAALSNAQALSLDVRFPLIYADPPWTFEVNSDLGKVLTSPENHYPTMSVDEICDLMVGHRHITEIVDDACALFLWCTSANLVVSALPVLEHWGFEYKTHAVWDKQRAGTGYVFRNQHEVLLYATRGDMPAPMFAPPSVFKYPRGKHSAKPPEIRRTLEKMYPAFDKRDRIELFARGKVPGWTVWGTKPSRMTRRCRPPQMSVRSNPRSRTRSSNCFWRKRKSGRRLTGSTAR
jgi:N6-adenosine-specific RNA methylase IME4